MLINAGLFSGKRKDWATSQWLFDQLNAEFHFTIDVCARHNNAKVDRYFSPEQNGLIQSWENETCWMNPPYGHEVVKWVSKAHEESKGGATIVALLPARTDTRWFHNYIYGKAEIRFLPGRLYFDDGPGRSPFPSMIVIWHSLTTEGV